MASPKASCEMGAVLSAALTFKGAIIQTVRKKTKTNFFITISGQRLAIMSCALSHSGEFFGRYFIARCACIEAFFMFPRI